MDARIKSGHDECGGGNVSVREAVGGRGGRQPHSCRTTEPETAGPL